MINIAGGLDIALLLESYFKLFFYSVESKNKIIEGFKNNSISNFMMLPKNNIGYICHYMKYNSKFGGAGHGNEFKTGACFF
jgi:hypothetical protein